MIILYGVEGNYKDVTLASLNMCRKEKGELYIPDKDYLRSSIYGDPMYGVLKHIILKDEKTGEERKIGEEHIYIDFSLFSPSIWESSMNEGYQEELLKYIKPFSPDILDKKNLFCFWTGLNPMPKKRFECFKTLEKSDMNVILITPLNLNSYVLQDHPLHPCYEHLTLTHRSDYLRSYFMRFYGGCYTDIKIIEDSWIPYSNKIDENDNIWVIGYPEKYPCDIANIEDKELYEKMKEVYYKMPGNGRFFVKKNTPLSIEWYDCVYKLLEDNKDQLVKYPYIEHPYYKSNVDHPYPLKWAAVCGNIFHTLAYKYIDHIDLSLPPLNIYDYKF